MNIKLKDEEFEVLRKLHRKSDINQREIAHELNFSLGKINYLINELKKKGLIKIQNFKKNPKKMKYLYYLTPRGIAEKTAVTINFMKIKMKEYEELKKEITKVKN
jgi:EPS-associated MarR family transcriptional regulator